MVDPKSIDFSTWSCPIQNISSTNYRLIPKAVWNAFALTTSFLTSRAANSFFFFAHLFYTNFTPGNIQPYPKWIWLCIFFSKLFLIHQSFVAISPKVWKTAPDAVHRPGNMMGCWFYFVQPVRKAFVATILATKSSISNYIQGRQRFSGRITGAYFLPKKVLNWRRLLSKREAPPIWISRKSAQKDGDY